MTNLYSYECQDHNSFMIKMYPCYVHLLCSTFLCWYYVYKMSKRYQNYIHYGPKLKQKICDDKNISFYFLETKIKIYYIYKDEKLT